MSEEDETENIMEEILPGEAMSTGNTLEENQPLFIENTAENTVEDLDVTVKPPSIHESIIPLVPGGPAPLSNASRYIVKDTGELLQYEKDGNWLLDKVPKYTFRKPKRQSTKETSPPRRKCCLEKDAKPRTLGQNVKAIYDVLSGRDSYPCNECDRPVCQESMWHWLSSIVLDIADSVREFTKKPDTCTTGVGSIDSETLKTNTKGTFTDMDEPPTESQLEIIVISPDTANSSVDDKSQALDLSEEVDSPRNSNEFAEIDQSRILNAEISPDPENIDIEIEIQEDEIQEAAPLSDLPPGEDQEATPPPDLPPGEVLEATPPPDLPPGEVQEATPLPDLPPEPELPLPEVIEVETQPAADEPPAADDS